MKRILQLTLALALLLPMTAAVAAPVNVTYTWTAPASGSTCVSYDVERSLDGGTSWAAYTTTTTTSAVVVAPELTPITVRVRGVDALGRKGAWSDPALPYTNDPGAPGACSRPVRQP
jgi:hypothetical protein